MQWIFSITLYFCDVIKYFEKSKNSFYEIQNVGRKNKLRLSYIFRKKQKGVQITFDNVSTFLLTWELEVHPNFFNLLKRIVEEFRVNPTHFERVVDTRKTR